MRKYYPGITLFKFAGAVMVMMAHLKEFPLNSTLNHQVTGFVQLCSIIVPCFYVMAGFLAYNGWKHSAQPARYVKRYILWTGAAYSVFCICYLFTDTLPLLYHGTFNRHSVNYLFEMFFITGPYWQLWFIPPLIVTISLGYLAERKKRLSALLVVAIIGFAAAQCVCGSLKSGTNGLIGDAALFRYKHFALVEKLILYYAGMAVPYVSAGIFIGRYEVGFVNLNKWRLIVPALLISFTELIFLRIAYPDGYSYPLLLAQFPLTILLFYGLLNVRNVHVKKYHAYLRQLSVFLFFTHIPLIRLNEWMMGWDHVHITLPQFAACMVLTFGQIMLIERVFERYRKRRRSAKQATAEVAVSTPAVAAADQQFS